MNGLGGESYDKNTKNQKKKKEYWPKVLRGIINGKPTYCRILIIRNRKSFYKPTLKDFWNWNMKKVKEQEAVEVFIMTPEEREEQGRKNTEYIKSLPVLGTVKIKKNSVLPCLDLLEKPEEPKKKKKKKE